MESYTLFEYFHNELANWKGFGADKDEHISILEDIGYKVGISLCENMCKDRPRFKEEVDVLRFLCRDFWELCFRRSANSLKTDNAGTYVIQDSEFRTLTALSSGKQFLTDAPKFLAYPCGLLRGALFALTLNAHVTVEVTQIPAAKFKIDILRK